MTAIERVIARAQAELGYIEKATNAQLDDKTANAGSRNWTKYARDLDEMGIYNGKKNGYDWCDVFVDWCYIKEFGKDLGLKLICQPEKSFGAGVNSSANYYKKANRLDKKPAVGDQLFFLDTSDGLFYHTGLVVAVYDDSITVIEGNATSKSDRVVQTTYKLNSRKIGAFGHPKWELVGDVAPAPQSKPEEPKKEEKPTAEPASIAIGNKVTLKDHAKVYGKDYEFSAWVYGKELYVRGIKGDKVTVSTQPDGDITGSVAAADVVPLSKAEKPAQPEQPKPAEPIQFKVGDKVRLKNHAMNYTGTTEFSAWVYWRDMYIRTLEGDRAIISTQPDSGITGAVNIKDLFLV